MLNSTGRRSRLSKGQKNSGIRHKKENCSTTTAKSRILTSARVPEQTIIAVAEHCNPWYTVIKSIYRNGATAADLAQPAIAKTKDSGEMTKLARTKNFPQDWYLLDSVSCSTELSGVADWKYFGLHAISCSRHLRLVYENRLYKGFNVYRKLFIFLLHAVS